MKTSKKSLSRLTIVLFLIRFYLCSSFGTAQVQGLYLTGNDFTNHKLSFKRGEEKKCKVKIRAYSFRANIKVVCNDSTYHLSKDSVFGYQEEGTIRRFYKKETYTMINPTENILLYKVPVASKTKYEETVFSYHFSKNALTPIYLLTINNLEACFENNKRFIELINTHYKNDNELLEYDNTHKVYKINRLLELSKNEK